MATFNTFKALNKLSDKEQLRLNLQKKTASGRLNVLAFIDNDTKQHVLYVPSLDISGYGETSKKANEMLQFVLIDFIKFLASLPNDDVPVELSRFGWKRTLFHKEYSRTYIDGSGGLKDFNAEDGKIERLTLEAA